MDEQSSDFYSSYQAYAHQQVDKNVSVAVTNYQAQQQRLMAQLNQPDEQAANQFLQALNENLLNELGSGADNTIDQKMDNIFGSVNAFFQSEQGSNIPEDLKLAIEEVEKRMRTDKSDRNAYYKNLYKNAKDAIENYLASNISNQANADWVNWLNLITKNRANTPDAVAISLRAYARRMIVLAASGEKLKIDITNYKRAIKGYYAEEAITDALKNTFQQYNSSFTAKNTGLITNEKGQQTVVDIVLFDNNKGKNKELDLSKLIEGMETNITATGTTDLYEDAFGIQSKSWVEPWLEGEAAKSIYTGYKGNQQFINMGNHSDILNGRRIFNWHTGIILASANMEKIIGPNVLFGTGTGIAWTAQLIQDFTSRGYYLAFYISKKNHEATGSVVWEQENSTPFDK